MKWYIPAAILALLATAALASDQPPVNVPDQPVMDDLRHLGLRIQDVDSRLTNWVSFTPTGAWNTNTTYTGKYRLVGDTMEVQFKIALAGAPNATAPTVNLPAGYTVDTAKILQTTADSTLLPLGQLQIEDAGTARLLGVILYSSTSAVALRYLDDGATGVTMNGMNATSPVTFASGDYLLGYFSVPVRGTGR